MKNFQDNYKIWLQNGAQQLLEEKSKFFEFRSQEENIEFGKNAALIAHALHFNDLFAAQPSDLQYSDDFLNLKKFIFDEEDNHHIQLMAKFCSDFMQQHPSSATPDKIRLDIMAKFKNFIAKDIVTEKNYSQAFSIFTNTFKAFENVILHNEKLDKYDKQRLAEKVFTPEMHSLDGKYELKSSQDYLKKLIIMENAITELQDFEKIKFLYEGVDASLWRNKEISDDYMQGIMQNIIPDIKTGKENTTEDNLWGMYAFDYGFGNFKYKALTTKITPSNLADIIRAYKETPSTDFTKFNQNRLDGLSLENVSQGSYYGGNRGLASLRDTIHDQRPQTAELITSMVSYYEAVKSNQGVEDAKNKMLTANKRNIGYQLEEDYLCDITNYEQKTLIAGTKDTYEPVIDILKRLAKNMNGDDRAPLTADKNLNLLAKGLEEKPFDKERLGVLLKRINDKLLTDMEDGHIGISPDMVALIVWTDKKCAHMINNMDYEYQFGAQDNEWFKQAVKFSMLINDSGEKFDEDRFNALTSPSQSLSIEERYALLAEEQKKYLINAQNSCILEGINYLVDIDPKLSKTDAAKMLSKKAYECGEVPAAEKFHKGEKLSASERRELLVIFQYHNRLESIGSGNTLKALQNLTLWHKASTRAGERHRAMRMAEQPQTDNLKHVLQVSQIDISYKGGRY